VLDLSDLERWAHALDVLADDLRTADARLSRALATTTWSSSAAGRFTEQAQQTSTSLLACADELVQAAEALRAHARAVRAREAQLGAAADAVLSAARGAASAGVAAVSSAMDGAQAAFAAAAREARERLEQGRRLLDSAIDAVT
jgi:hypothetical protein